MGKIYHNNKFMKIKFKHSLFTFFITVQFVFGWGKTGHRIVGEIAENYLTKNSKLQIKKLIGHHNLSRISNWADEIKSDPKWDHAYDWHYCTIPDGEDYEKGKHKGQAVEKVFDFTKTLKDKKSTKEDKIIALKFLVHLIGDLHQPLHVGNGKDRGGNDVKVKWFGEATNLHNVWDKTHKTSRVKLHRIFKLSIIKHRLFFNSRMARN